MTRKRIRSELVSREVAQKATETQVRALLHELQANSVRIKALLDRLVTVQEEERRRLALNLHDHLGQQLTALRLALAGLREATDPPDQEKRFELIESIVSQLDRDVDFLAWDLRPAALDDVGLDAAVSQFLNKWSAVNEVQVDFHHSTHDGTRISGDVESHLYRVVQEALNNVSKHAGATRVSVILERRADDVILIVEDDGGGFNSDDERIRRRGMGLTGIEERAASMGGNVDLESSAGKGTTLFVRVPLSVAGSAKTGAKSAEFDQN